MWPDRVSNLGPLIYESGALPIALRGLAETRSNHHIKVCANLPIFSASSGSKSFNI